MKIASPPRTRSALTRTSAGPSTSPSTKSTQKVTATWRPTTSAASWPRTAMRTSWPLLDVIKDCAIVDVAAIGGSAAARVVATKIHPVKVAGPEPILDILDKLQDVLKGTPPVVAQGPRQERGTGSTTLKKRPEK